MKPSLFILCACITLLSAFISPAVAYADVYEIYMSQVDPAGETIKAVCIADRLVPCVKTFKMPISINGNEPRNVDVEVIIDANKKFYAEFVLERRYPLSVTETYYAPFKMYWKMEAVKVETIRLFALTDKKTNPDHAVWKGPTIIVATIEIAVHRREE